jgi:GNAT superfamily N-acetyltransferase
MDFSIETVNYPFSEKLTEELHGLEIKIFGHVKKKKWAKLPDYTDVFVVTSRSQDGELMGFKLGMKASPGIYYSWVGGVLDDYRRKGLATAMMAAQHDKCRQLGYKKVQTKTYNRWRDMLILNIKYGFNIVSCAPRGNGDTKILLQLKL